MSTKKEEYVRRISCICYKELSQSLRVVRNRLTIFESLFTRLYVQKI